MGPGEMKTTTQTMNVSPNTPRSLLLINVPTFEPSFFYMYSQITQSHAPAGVILRPCAACKILQRRCNEKRVLASHFPPTDPFRFTIARGVFGANNIIKHLGVSQAALGSQELDDVARSETLRAMVNLKGSVGGKWGARMRFSSHWRRRILHAAQRPEDHSRRRKRLGYLRIYIEEEGGFESRDVDDEKR